MNNKMFIISLDSNIVNVALEGNTTFLYERLVTQNGVNLEVVEINPNIAKCIVYGNIASLYPNMIVNRTNNYLTIKFNTSKLGKVVDPNMNIISDGIFESTSTSTDEKINLDKKEKNKKTNKKSTDNTSELSCGDIEISLSPKAYSINQIGSNNIVMYTGIKVIDFCTPITFGCKIGVQGGAGVGKAQPMNSKLYTNSGYIYMKDAEVGKEIMGKNGLVKITGVYPQGFKKIFKLEFEDNRCVECCENHIWPIVYKDSMDSILCLELKDINIEDAYIPLYPVNFQCNRYYDLCDMIIYGMYITKRISKHESINDNLLISKYIHKDLLSLLTNKYEIINEYDAFLLIRYQNFEKIKNINISDICCVSLDLRRLFISSIFNISHYIFENNNIRNYVLEVDNNLEKYILEIVDIIRSTSNICYLNENQCEIVIGKKFMKIKSVKHVRDDLAQCIAVNNENGLYFTDNFTITHNTVLTQAILSNVQKINDLSGDAKLFRIFCGIGERLREGRDMYCEFVNSGIIDINEPEKSNAILVYGNMDQPASIRQLSARVGIAISRYMMDEKNMNVLLIIDNIFRYNQAMSEISAALDQYQTEKGYHPNIYTKMSELQENIAILNNNRSITSIQAIYVPADDADDIGAKTCVKQQSVNIFLSRDYAKRKMFPAIDPLKSVSIYIKKEIVGPRHVQVYNEYIQILNKNRELQDMINMIGIENLSDEDQLTVKRASLLEAYMTQPLSTSKQFMNLDAQLIDIKDVIEDVSDIINGVYDNINPDKLKYQGTIKHLKE